MTLLPPPLLLHMHVCLALPSPSCLSASLCFSSLVNIQHSVPLLLLHLFLLALLHQVQVSRTFLLCLLSLFMVQQPLCCSLRGALLRFFHELHSSNGILLQLQEGKRSHPATPPTMIVIFWELSSYFPLLLHCEEFRRLLLNAALKNQQSGVFIRVLYSGQHLTCD